jgi:lipopolysaccharide export system protein LptA
MSIGTAAGHAKGIRALPRQLRDTWIRQTDRDPGAGGLWWKSRRRSPIAVMAAAFAFMAMVSSGHTQQLDMSHGGPIAITATDGMEWRQEQRQVIARGNATAVRQNVTVTADRLIAFYRPKAGTAAQPAQPAPGGINDPSDAGGNEIYRVEAVGKVHIFTPTDNAWGDRAVYDIDQSVLVLTGRNLKLTTPNDVLTARDDLEYWSQKHMAVARGDAVAVTNDGRRMSADTLVAYTTEGSPPPAARATPVAVKTPAAAATDDPMAASGKLQKVEAYGHVTIRTVTDTATGDRAVYVPDTGIARLAGKVRITRGQNQLNGTEAEVNMKTGISRLLAGGEGRVQGLMVPNDATNQQLTGQPPAAPPSAQPPGAKP